MKKFLCVLTMALTAAVTSLSAVAYAEDTGGYPQLASPLTFTALTSYAVNDGGTQFAFAEGNYIYIFEGSEVTDGTYSGTLDNDDVNLYYYEHKSAVTDVAYNGGDLVFTDGSASYKLDGGKAVAGDYAFENSSYASYNNLYYSTNGGNLNFWDGSSSDSLSDGAYSCVKVCGGGLYAIKDNALCRVTGSAITDVAVQPLTFEYLDLTLGATIPTGNAADELLKVNADVSFVTLDKGTYVTNVDLSDLSGSYFSVGSMGTFAVTDATTYLYIGSVNNVYIISDGNDVYLTSDKAVPQSAALQSYASSSALINMAVNAYSVPYMCDSTAVAELAYGTKVTVKGVISDEVLQCDFAYVEFTADDGATAYGYVAVNFLTEYDFAAEDGSYGGAEYVNGYEDDNVILSVILVLVIVVLVIIGIAFIWYSSARQKHGDKNGK